MFIRISHTPNPLTHSYYPGQAVATTPTEFANSTDAGSSVLALDLFDIPGVTRVFLGQDFISVSIKEDESWEWLDPQILEVLLNHFQSNETIHETDSKEPEPIGSPEDQETIKEIQAIIDQRIRPSIALDGGDVVLKKFQNGIVTLALRGACYGCPSSTATLKMGIERMLKHYVRGVMGVVQE